MDSNAWFKQLHLDLKKSELDTCSYQQFFSHQDRYYHLPIYLPSFLNHPVCRTNVWSETMINFDKVSEHCVVVAVEYGHSHLIWHIYLPSWITLYFVPMFDLKLWQSSIKVSEHCEVVAVECGHSHLIWHIYRPPNFLRHLYKSHSLKSFQLHIPSPSTTDKIKYSKTEHLYPYWNWQK